jgi:hypothetical protein
MLPGPVRPRPGRAQPSPPTVRALAAACPSPHLDGPLLAQATGGEFAHGDLDSGVVRTDEAVRLDGVSPPSGRSRTGATGR